MDNFTYQTIYKFGVCKIFFKVGYYADKGWIFYY